MKVMTPGTLFLLCPLILSTRLVTGQHFHKTRQFYQLSSTSQNGFGPLKHENPHFHIRGSIQIILRIFLGRKSQLGLTLPPPTQIIVQVGPKLNTKLGLNHHPPPPTRNFSTVSRHSRRLRFDM